MTSEVSLSVCILVMVSALIGSSIPFVLMYKMMKNAQWVHKKHRPFDAYEDYLSDDSEEIPF